MEGKQKVALTFALYQNEALVRRETVTQDIVKVGKDPKSHLRVDDELASRMHAVIEVASPEDITLIDLGNEPGTLVNGARVNKVKIKANDQLQIGGTKIVLEKAEPVAVAGGAAKAPGNPFGAAPAANPFGAAPAANPFAAAGGNPFAAAPAAAPSPFGGGGDPFGMNNPFAQPKPPSHDDVPHDAPEGSYTYQLVKSGPDVPNEEVETPSASVEVMVLWDQMVLHVSHLTPPRSFYVGEEESKNFKCDYFVPQEKIGTTRAPVVLADRGGSVSVVLLPRAKGTIELAGQPKMTVQQAIDSGKTQPCSELSGAFQIALPPGSKARIDVDGLIFQVSTVNAGRVVAGHVQFDTQNYLYHGLSMAVHLGLLAAMAFFMPPLGATDEDGVSDDQKFMIQQFLNAAAEKEMEEKETEQVADNAADNKEGGTGTRAKGEEGSMGNPNTKSSGNRYGVQGPADNADPHIARQAALRDAAEFGMIGLLNSGAGGDPNAPTAPWGRDDSLGNDALSARGNMWGDNIGDSFGAGGLGLSGIGEGGGGRGEGIGLGSIGTIGHGAGTGTGQGFGSGHGRLSGSHRTKPPQVRMGATSVSGRLPPEVIQRIVRQNFGRFRLCYENGLRNNPNLQGRVGVRFVIGRDGAVSNVGNGGSDMPDGGVVSCVVRAFYGLSFPQPEGGIVTVVYPIMFSPGG
ncbi:AgmX/PglI C-terminal domain-containing protein [Polyangium sorediatum]|uniref:AgmX/PglI C-terminal domain-containing protein n=1 Tax=Polyangium sorediatum TaxID=889274 RepID=A0ABT6NQD2_9BACT|nr:AgmX/PglI C-terminal domain-containing protein [Polyangium sorediatum]MDI1430519.1 AgmX/PglI C-terminal domain-containing protein [Polyangium sorediatum]